MESITVLNDSNIKKICRTCLRINTEEMISIFDEIEQGDNDENVKTNICDMLVDVALIELRKESLPTLICVNCLRLAQLLFNFRKQCNRSQAILLEYLTEKEDKIIGIKSVITELIDIEKSVNEIKQKSVTVENDVHEFSNTLSSDDLLNTSIKLEFDDQIIDPDTERENKIIGTSDIKKNLNEDDDVLNETSPFKESIDIENEDKCGSLDNDHELLNPSSSDDLLNTDIKLDIVDEIIKSDTENESKETLHSKVNYDKDENVSPFLACQLCDKSFETDPLYFAHLKEHTLDCNICGINFKYRGHLNAHKKQQHTGAGVVKFVCKICNKHFSGREDLIIHRKQQHTEDKCVCHVCNKHFQHPRNLVAHMYIHKDEKRYSCKICGKPYKQLNTLAVHKRTHTGEKPYLCSVCGKGFRDSATRNTHERIHTKERPYMCNICGKTMSRQGQFTRHMRAHTGEKPYKCTECSKAFHSSDLLRKHSIIHTGLKPFSCDVCKKSFNQKSNLKFHEKIHTNERPHVCSLCGKAFIYRHCLKTHLQNHK